MLSRIFEKLKPFLKFVLAIGILLGLSGFIYFAHQQATVEWEAFEKDESNKDSMTNEIRIDNYELKEVDDNEQLKWILSAKSGILEPKTKDVNLKEIVVKYFNEGEVSMTISAPQGIANELTRKILLTSNKTAKVMGIGAKKNTKLITDKLELTKINQFSASGGVNIEWPGVAKVTGKTAEGVMSPTKFVDKLVLRGDVHARLSM